MREKWSNDNNDCYFEKVGMKKPFRSNSVCMKEVNKYGVQQYNSPRLESIMPRMDNDGCSFDTDCPKDVR